MCNKSERLKIVISSPDSYRDVFDVYYKCFMKFCTDSPYELILASNNAKYDGISVINNHKTDDNWTERILPILRQINSKYVLIMCDDIFITDRVNYSSVELILDEMDEKNINFCGMLNKIGGKKLCRDSLLNFVKKRKPYALNLQMGIYNRDYLLEVLGDGEKSAWDIEKKWVKEVYDAPNEYFSDVVCCKKNIFNCIHGIEKGKWFPSAVKKLKKIGISVDDSRAKMSRFQEFKNTLKGKIGKMLGVRARMFIKKIMSRFGMKFVTDN